LQERSHVSSCETRLGQASSDTSKAVGAVHVAFVRFVRTCESGDENDDSSGYTERRMSAGCSEAHRIRVAADVSGCCPVRCTSSGDLRRPYTARGKPCRDSTASKAASTCVQKRGPFRIQGLRLQETTCTVTSG
jgi:hypothetical protein